MAEHFYGRNDIVHVTNSGCEALVVSLIATGEQMAQDPALAAVVAFLRLPGPSWRTAPSLLILLLRSSKTPCGCGLWRVS